METTGGKFDEEGITEIAIYRFDGHDITDQFISLVNPEREIQPFVANLTGINSKMLRNAPRFYELAKRIVEITEDCIIVAHNADFDYRILRTEFRRLGYGYKRKTLCTVELAQSLIPNMESYSLGKLSRALGIAVSDRHRASGDAQATLKLFKILLHKDLDKVIITSAVKTEVKSKMPGNLKTIVEELPSVTGVYYIHDSKGHIIYIGKSRNIKKRINQHFTGKDGKSKKIQLQVAAVTYEKTGSELVALLRENAEIKKNKPLFNHALKRDIFSHAITHYKDEYGYINFKIISARANEYQLTTFPNRRSAVSFLTRITEEYELCEKLTDISMSQSNCFSNEIGTCNGACTQDESFEDYNIRAQKVIDTYSFESKNLLIVDRGPSIEERSVILIKNGRFQGLGHFDLNYQINNPSVLENFITSMDHNRDTQHIIQNYMRKNLKRIKIIHFED
ncbi:MAG: exonuclease domain-containing protein [Bacteroidota bacterium]